LPLTYSDLRMPDETRYYVPKLQAVKNIVRQPEAFNTQLPLIQNHPYFKSVAIERDIDVDMAAKLANPRFIVFDSANTPYGSDVDAFRVHAVDLATGIIRSVIGCPESYSAGRANLNRA
jgi:hypothetical protein